MDDKIKEVKIAILDRILMNVSDKEKALNTDTIVAFAGVVETFDKTEEYKKQPKSDPDLLYKHLIEIMEKSNKKDEEEKLPDKGVEETL